MPMPSRRRHGFTLIELLVVIILIAVLVALLLPAIQGAMRSTSNAVVTGDINTIAQALASFKEKYGDYPPSRVMLSENGRYDIDPGDPTTPRPPGKMIAVSANGTAGSDITYAQLAQRSLYYLRKFFPRTQFSTSGAAPGISATSFYDFNGNASPDFDTDASDGFYGVILEGDECLCFFLGGIPMNTGTTGDPKWSGTGFGKLPTNPFSNNLGVGAVMYGAARNPPLYEFRPERLADPDGDGFPSYIDSLGTNRPFAYFSAYAGEAYDPNDVNVAEADPDASTAKIMGAFHVSFGVKDNAGAAFQIASSTAPNPYTVSPANGATNTTWQKGQTFQLISAGRDGLYGAGGQFAPNSTIHLPPGAAADTIPSGLNRQAERDNLTNFSGTVLD